MATFFKFWCKVDSLKWSYCFNLALKARLSSKRKESNRQNMQFCNSCSNGNLIMHIVNHAKSWCWADFLSESWRLFWYIPNFQYFIIFLETTKNQQFSPLAHWRHYYDDPLKILGAGREHSANNRRAIRAEREQSMIID